jgi:DNA-binding MarR family transcriptional regulator
MRPLASEQVAARCANVAGDCACEGLRRASRAISRLYERALAPLALTPTQFAILVATRLRGPVPLSRLATGLVLDRTSLYRAIRPLERQGHLRVGVGKTQRERAATVTAKGEHLLQQALPIWDATQRTFVSALGTRTWTALSAAVGQVVPVVRAIESREPPSPRRRRRSPAGPR